MERLLRYASDREGFSYLAQLSPDLFWICVWLTVAFCAIHVIRRAHSRLPAKPAIGYNRNQRLYHWGNLALLALVSISGYWLFFRAAPHAPFGLTWLQIHSWAGIVFTGGVVFHAIVATVRGDWRSMRPELRDLRDAAVIWRNFLGRTTDYPASGRYDALQKIYHHLLSVLALTFAISGILMWFSAERIYLAGRDGLHAMRWVHDLSAFALIVMVVGHIYFSLIKANRANLKDMAGLKPTGQPNEEVAD